MTTAVSHPDYPAFLAALKERILRARISAAHAANHELVLLYWDIGRGIMEKQQTAGWGDAVVERLAADLRDEFPDIRGFSVGNIWRMRQFYQIHTQPEFLAQPARELGGNVRAGRTKYHLAQLARELLVQIPWWHHVELIAKVKDPVAHYYYLRATARFGWSRNVLLN